MSTTVYIVLAEHGEYSDRDVWAAGVFTSHEAAKAYVLAASERRRVFVAWDNARSAYLRSIGLGGWWGPWGVPEQVAHFEAQDAAAAEWERNNPKPPFEMGERFEIKSAILDDTAEPVTVEEFDAAAALEFGMVREVRRKA